MPIVDSSMTRNRYQAPQQHGTTLIRPPLDKAVAQLKSPPHTEGNNNYICGLQLTDLRKEARKQLLTAAASYTQAYRDAAVPDADAAICKIVLSGHQPDLFHPGVWFKNFILDELARRSSAVPIHLNIDNDLCVAPGVRVPTGGIVAPRIQFIPWDRQPSVSIPYEDRPLMDPSIFKSFGACVTKSLDSLIREPLIMNMWPTAIAAMQETTNLGRLLSQSRHQLEGQWGRQTNELPLSSVCDTNSFRCFVLEIGRRGREFLDIHNATLSEYRRIHRLRSHSHPVPDLILDEDWTEIPFWIWSTGDPRRRRLFVKNTPNSLLLRGGLARDNVVSDIDPVSLPLTNSGKADDAIEVWQTLRATGIKVRPRAIMTTLYARLFLSDLFVHGIGGAKYDELTDELSRRFFGLNLSPYITVTATFRLPVSVPPVTEDDLRKISGILRELWYHPEKYLHEAGTPLAQQVDRFIADKRRLFNLEPPPDGRQSRHQQLETVNRELRQQVAPLREVLLIEQEQLQEQLSTARTLDSREFSLCLFPEETLCKGLINLAQRA